MSVNGSHGYDEPIGVSVVHQFISVNGISLHVAQCGDQDEDRLLQFSCMDFQNFGGRGDIKLAP